MLAHETLLQFASVTAAITERDVRIVTLLSAGHETVATLWQAYGTLCCRDHHRRWLRILLSIIAPFFLISRVA
jgi:hypothetical protein